MNVTNHPTVESPTSKHCQEEENLHVTAWSWPGMILIRGLLKIAKALPIGDCTI